MHISCIDILQNPEARARSNSRDSGVYYEISWDNPLHGLCLFAYFLIANDG